MTDRDELPGAGPAAPVDRTPFSPAELAALGPSDPHRAAPAEPGPYGAGAGSGAPVDRSPDHHRTAPPAPYGGPRSAGPPGGPAGDTGPAPYGGGAEPSRTPSPSGPPGPPGQTGPTTLANPPGRPGGEPAPVAPYGTGPSRPADRHPGGGNQPGTPRAPFPGPGIPSYRSPSPYQAPPAQPQRPQGVPGGAPSPYGGGSDRPGWASPPGAGYPSAPPQRPGYEPARQPFPADPFPPRRRRGRRVPALVLIAAVVVTALVCGVLGGVAGGVVQAQRDEPTASPSPTAAAGSIGAIVKRVLPSVVSVIVPQSDGSEYVGAGSIISKDGYIMTNEHVVATTKDNGGKVKVELNNGEQINASVKGMSSTADIAVLKVDRTGLPPITFGDSRKVQVGDRVIAVGNPLGLAETTTSGIVSALNRPVHVNQHSDSYYAAIQTDAAINPGNSGGPLFDMNGRLIGVNYAGAAKQNVGLGFAIPARSAQRTAQQLIRTGKSTHAVIGVYTDTRYTGDGAKIAEDPVDGKDPVSAGGPADKAGMHAGDVITRINDIPIHSSSGLTAVIRTQAPGDIVTAVYEHSGSPTTTKMTLGEQSDQ